MNKWSQAGALQLLNIGYSIICYVKSFHTYSCPYFCITVSYISCSRGRPSASNASLGVRSRGMLEKYSSSSASLAVHLLSASKTLTISVLYADIDRRQLSELSVRTRKWAAIDCCFNIRNILVCLWLQISSLLYLDTIPNRFKKSQS